ncbi:hypothetical protein FHS39_002407 [Streptomyces olivoverticillatus]|uniref:Uncharacterized protein n=1 Tax=Streptomyces olivoverticillatus TaxID=66427 RepID=A0A7W7PJN9_9ACTN|nr:hypothetical protein [Streptomyces olivoverticillatus]
MGRLRFLLGLDADTLDLSVLPSERTGATRSC